MSTSDGGIYLTRDLLPKAMHNYNNKIIQQWTNYEGLDDLWNLYVRYLAHIFKKKTHTHTHIKYKSNIFFFFVFCLIINIFLKRSFLYIIGPLK